MMRRGRYYISRVIKLGQLDQEKFINALIDATTVKIGKYNWTIINLVDGRNTPFPYIFGELAKYSSEGHVKTVDPEAKADVETPAPNLLIASSPFVYLLKFSGLAYLRVWNNIQGDIFPRRIKSIVEAKYGNFFVDCTIEPVADYREFAAKLKTINRFSEISAKVHPPNPLFGRLWGSLKEYVKRRNAGEISIKEVNESDSGIRTEIAVYIEEILKNKNYEPLHEPDITDAALLMAADGYGSAKVIGSSGSDLIVVKTSDTQISFLFAKEPIPNELAEKAGKHFMRISIERNMKH